MFGTYRLILASLVALSHFGLVGAGFNPGQWSVLSFYVLSGFLMEHQFRKLSTSGNSRAFYTDRFLRVFPVFIIVLLFAAILMRPVWWVLLINASLILLNYCSFAGVAILIGPTWSLACEAQFYALVPMFARASTPMIRWLALGSIAFFVATLFMPDSIWWAYSSLPGILFAFLSGILIRRKDVLFLRYVWCVFVVLLIGFACFKFGRLALPADVHINVCIGYLAALPLVFLLSTYPPDSKWDQSLGLLSYPLFLVHMPLGVFMAAHMANANMFGQLFFAMIAAGLLVLLVEKPFDNIRYKVRLASKLASPNLI